MNRALAIAVLLSASLASTAAAQDCLCGAGAWQVTPTFGMDEPQVAAETHDTTILSDRIVSVLVVAAAPRPAHAASVLWCTSGSDPRCMPMQPSDAPAFQALSAGPVAITIDATRPRFTHVARELTSVTPIEGLAPAHGVSRSIDRPPRG
jgi:hypothetical protein